MGGSSAFGAKAGDVFTRITIAVATVWILLCIAAAKWATPTTGSRITDNAPAAGQAAISATSEDDEESGESATESDGNGAAPADGAGASGESNEAPAEGASETDPE